MPLGESWSLTSEISPRPLVRVAVREADGTIANSYPRLVALEDDEPAEPWAMMLADETHAYRFLALDFDAKNDRAAPARDAKKLSTLLRAVGIEHVVCESGPSGGRHVWIALAEFVHADTARDVGDIVRALCPSLDITPLRNPATGCVRPPGSPHAAGGTSRVIDGDLDALRRPTTTHAQLGALAEAINAERPGAPTGRRSPGLDLPVDDDGTPYLPGGRGQLPPASRDALATAITAEHDASAVLWTILLGAAAARWRFRDVAALLADAPGLEHARTRRSKHGGRRPRPSSGGQSPSAILRYNWRRAVEHVVTQPRTAHGHDPSFDHRAGAIADLVERIQHRATAMAGRWVTGRGPSERRILDLLCELALDAVRADLEADIRRLALLAGVGRETARTALQQLAHDGWITQVCEASGPNGARWQINDTDVLHNDTDTRRPQVNTPPLPSAGIHRRATAHDALSHTRTDRAHDCFAGEARRHILGNLFAILSTAHSCGDLARGLGTTTVTTNALLHALTRLGLAHLSGLVWNRAELVRRDVVAHDVGLAGRLEQRTERYRLERAVWAWWQSENRWMAAPHDEKPRRKPFGSKLERPTFKPVDPTGRAYPRRGRRGDHRAAMTALVERDAA